MAVGDIIYSLITLILMVLILSSPIIRKVIKSVGKSSKGENPAVDSIYESVDSHRVIERNLIVREQTPQVEFSVPKPLVHIRNSMYDEKETVMKKLDRMSPLKRAVIWKEILDKPVGMRDS